MAQETLDLTGLAYFKAKLASWIPSWFPSQSGQSGKVLTTDGSSLSWTTPAASVTTDGVTIDKNNDDELEAVAVMNANGGGTALKSWSGTKAQYEALVSGGTVDANTLYNITDDTPISASMLELLFPVGAIYVGVMQTCPLATLGVGTWTLVAQNRSLQGSGDNVAGTNVSAGLPNILGTHTGGYGVDRSRTGAFSGTWSRAASSGGDYSNSGSDNGWEIAFDASKSSSIYGASNTVQPPAYIVNIWQRTA